MQETLTILEKQYDLKESHIRLLKALINNERTARELVKKTKIPVGSIYELLDELVSMKIVKVKKQPYKTYYIDDFEQAIADFADEKINQQASAREELLKSIRSAKQKVEAYDDYFEFKLGCIKYDPKPKRIYGVISNMQFPRFMFPENKKDYLKYKQLIKKHLGAEFSESEEIRNSINVKKYEELEKSCKDFRWVLNKDEMRMFRRIAAKLDGLRELRKRIQDARKRGVKIRITNERKEQFILTDKSVQMQIRDQPLFIGLIVVDSKTVSAYEKLFSGIWRRAD